MKNINDLNPTFTISQHYSYKLPGGDEDIPVSTEDDDMGEGSDDDAVTLLDDESGDDEDVDYDGTPVPTEEELEEEIFTKDDF
jgi:hypothetical protein